MCPLDGYLVIIHDNLTEKSLLLVTQKFEKPEKKSLEEEWTKIVGDELRSIGETYFKRFRCYIVKKKIGHPGNF